MLTYVRQLLLDEARKSPVLLSDLAGLESYVAESYDARSFVELLQNADDAGASRFTIRRFGDFFLVANDGHSFTEAEFESLCRSAASSKHRGSSIGYRGIGFKSVVGFAETVHVLSGELQATFCRERTAREIPQATRVPLIRIPHPLESADRSEFAEAAERMVDEGFTTIFVFAGLIATSIEAEFAAFDPTSLLFLRNVRKVELNVEVETIITIERDTSNPRIRSLRLASSQGVAQWSIFEQDAVALGFIHDETGIVRLDEGRAVVHAFLPTHESTGFPFKLNGDISTDPSRTRIVLDKRTAEGIETAARFIVELIRECLTGSGDPHLMVALVPLSDPRIAGFQRRSFKTDLYSAIKRAATGFFANVLCRPSWLNAVDFEKLAEQAGIAALPRRYDGIEGFNGFLKFLGAKEATFHSIAPALESVSPTVGGAVETLAHLATLHSTKQIEASALNPAWKLWQIGDSVVSLEEANRTRKPLANEFVEKVAEKASSSVELQRLLITMSDSGTAAGLIPIKELLGSASQSLQPSLTHNTQQISLKRWRAAEEQVLSLLTARGWKVEDVSRQNIGYDIEGVTEEGKEACVEVKAIDYPGQPFTLTGNEEVVARQKGKAYRLAIVCQTSDHLEVAFIHDPIKQLKLTRQCRQWVWECQGYVYSPERFALE